MILLMLNIMEKGIVAKKFVDLLFAFNRFSASDSFVGYQEDTPSSVILHVSNITQDEEHDEKQVFLDKI